MDASNSLTRADDCSRVDSLWFDDGGLVLLAGTKLFKIYRGLLAARSIVFSDMLSVPQPPSAVDTYDGCPLVRMLDDAEELEAYLRAIFDSGYISALATGSPAESLAPLIGIAYLSHKYRTPMVHANVLLVLSKLFPTSLTDFNGLKHTISTPPVALAHAIVILRQIGAEWCLPTAYYLLARDCPSEQMHFHFPLASTELLTALGGARKQALAIRRVIAVLATPIPDPCNSQNTCRLSETNLALIEYICRHSDLPEFGHCGICDPLFIKGVASWRRQSMTCKPSFYGLTSWEDLVQKRTRVLA
ncbi:hypothetical protein DL96DRAFT_1613600 [Flagelloscypha sp. PMI_526]|nr:hypothetical protein DL96DRAFT_1613600 [Flagelloscypha sp. PMI_526]